MKTLYYAIRFLLRTKSYTIINLLGLAFSLACCIISVSYTHLDVYKRQQENKKKQVKKKCTC